MKRIVLIIILALLLAGCAPQSSQQIVPVETVVAQTMAALYPTPSGTPTPINVTPVATDAMGATLPPPLTLLGADCLPPASERQTARVTRILSGDTIEVAMDNAVYAVRYIGLRAPLAASISAPTGEWFGAEANAANKQLVSSQVVTLVKDTTDQDAQGRLLRYVLTDGVFVNYELLRLGLANAVPELPDVLCQESFVQAEQQARLAMTGLWGPTPIPTATFTLTPTVTPDVTATPTLEPACDCSPKDKDRVTCNSFSSQADSQACFEYCKATGHGDVFGLDKNGNGKTCEGMP